MESQRKLKDRYKSPDHQWFWARTEEKVSRLIGTHQLIHLNYYPYIARFKNISLLITLILKLLKTKIKILQAPGPSPVRIHKITFIFCASCSWDGSPRLPGAGSQGDHQQLRHWEEFLWGDGCQPERCEELCARYCRVFVQIFPTPSDCQVSSCDDWRSSEGSSRVWDVCTRTKPWWLIALSFTATWNSFHIDKFDAGERCDWGREQSICSTSWQRSVGEGNCRKCCQGALCQGGLRVWRHRQCYLVLLMMYIW